jgi:dethiobiotin synthetase
MPAVFVTGTDTGVGKTYVAAGLARALVARGLCAVGYKPVATGAERSAAGLRNADADALLAAGSPGFDYSEINPYAFEPAAIPHVAAAASRVRLSVERLYAPFRTLASRADWVVVEGAGGWRVPVDARDSLADLARRIAGPVVLVVGVRLGCINHALLSAEAIERDGCRLGAWVANEVDAGFDAGAQAVDAISERIGKPPAARIRRDSRAINALQFAVLAEILLQAPA